MSSLVHGLTSWPIEVARHPGAFFTVSCLSCIHHPHFMICFENETLLQPQGRVLIGQVLEVLCVNHTEL